MSAQDPGRASRQARWPAAVPLVVVGLIVALLGDGLVAEVGAPDLVWWSGSSQTSGQVLSSGCLPEPDDDGYCQRVSRDAMRRTPVVDYLPQVRREHERRVEWAASRAPWCTPAATTTVDPSGTQPRPSLPRQDDPGCYQHRGTRPPTETDAAHVRAFLVAAGSPDVTVRLAHVDDPAPRGSLVYAVRLNDVCVVGYQRTVPAGPVSSSAVGLLPGGRCL